MPEESVPCLSTLWPASTSRAGCRRPARRTSCLVSAPRVLGSFGRPLAVGPGSFLAVKPPSGLRARRAPTAISPSSIVQKDLNLKTGNSVGWLNMRLDISGQFVVNVVTPNGGWSKGRPIALIEDEEKWQVADLLIPNDLSDSA